MREMVLNHASLAASDRTTVVDWLKDATIGMSVLVQERVVGKALRMCYDVHDICCLADWSLWDAYQELSRQGARDEFAFLMRLTNKLPLLSDTGEEVIDRFHACEAKMLPPPDGEPLVLCAITDGIAIGFPSESTWDKDQLTVEFEELLPDEHIGEASEQIDNLTRAAHAQPICDRHREGLRQITNPAFIWENRQQIFPKLVFAPRVQGDLAALNRETLQIVIRRLASIDRSALEWPTMGGALPQWECNVTGESRSVMTNPKLLGYRYFQSHAGRRELFQWHARFGSGGRIHLRFDPHSYEVEIGYIGKHLPL